MLLRTIRLRHDRRGVSNVIVVMLSLVLIAVAVSNVISWSYQMNDIDLERMQEKINVSNVTRVTRSPWSTPITDYTITAGSKIGGNYTLTKTLDNVGERFREERTQIFNPASYTPNDATRLVSGNISDLTSNDGNYMSFRSYPNYEFRYQENLGNSSTTSTTYQDKVSIIFSPQVTTSETYGLCLNNDFKMDLNAYPLSYVRGIEILIRYNTTIDSEKWFLRAFNWSSSDFEVLDIQGNQPIANQWNDYAANVTNQWEDYVNSDGTIRLEFADQGNGTDQATIEIDFQGVRVMIDGTSVRLKNSGQYSAHIVAIWIINFTNHQRYSASLFINSGEETEYLRVDLNLLEGNFTTRVVTERGNIAVFP